MFPSTGSGGVLDINVGTTFFKTSECGVVHRVYVTYVLFGALKRGCGSLPLLVLTPALRHPTLCRRPRGARPSYVRNEKYQFLSDCGSAESCLQPWPMSFLPTAALRRRTCKNIVGATMLVQQRHQQEASESRFANSYEFRCSGTAIGKTKFIHLHVDSRIKIIEA